MPDLTLEQARLKRQRRTAVAWIGGCGFVLLLAVGQLALVEWWAYKRAAVQITRLKEAKRVQARTEHPLLPAWVPVYADGEPKGAVGEKGGEVALHTKDKPERVLDFYADRLRGNGFELAPRTQEAQVYKLEARRLDGREITVQSGESHTGTWIVVTYKAGG